MNKTKNCTGKDNFERLNYLYQLSNYTLCKERKSLSSSYSHLLLNIAQKCVQRIEPEMKRTLCKKCHILVVPGVSAKVRIKKKKLFWICKQCSTSKIFKTEKDYRPWFQNPESIIETLTYNK